MDVPMGLCKLDLIGKSVRSFNSETGPEAARPQSLLFHAARKNL
jgi:hypothetical protein